MKENNNQNYFVRYAFLKKGLNKIAELFCDDEGYIKELKFKEIDSSKAFSILLENALTNKRSISSSGESEENEIGKKDLPIYIVSRILFKNNRNKNLILKLFNFYPEGILEKDLF